MPEPVGQIINRKMTAIAKNLTKIDKVALGAASLEVKKAIVEQARRDTGDGRMGNVGRGVKLNVRFDVKGHQSTIRAVPPGVWSMLSSGTRPHMIRPRRRRGKRALTTPYGLFSRVWHPGSRGKRTWTRGLDRGLPKAVDQLRRPALTAVRVGLRQG